MALALAGGAVLVWVSWSCPFALGHDGDEVDLPAGSPCLIDGSAGECRLLEDCPCAMQQLLGDRRRPQQHCSWTDESENVCCPSGPPGPSQPQYAPGVIARQKCEDFSEQYRKQKGIAPVEGFVVNGKPASAKEFPHMALINYGNQSNRLDYACGGSLISTRFVLSAAHCLYDVNDRVARGVLLGELDRGTELDDAQPQYLGIERRHLHDRWRYPAMYGDAVLFELESDAQLSAYVWPICLWTRFNLPASNETTLVTGWGQNTTVSEGYMTDMLMKGSMKPIPHRNCSSSFSVYIEHNTKGFIPHGFDEQIQFCAGLEIPEGDNTTSSTCKGDSGGPLQVQTDSPYLHMPMLHVFGITSFAKQTCGTGPVVFTRVSGIVSWVERTVWPAECVYYPSSYA